MILFGKFEQQVQVPYPLHKFNFSVYEQKNSIKVQPLGRQNKTFSLEFFESTF